MTTLADVVDGITKTLEKEITALPLGREDQQKVVTIVFDALRTVADFLTKNNDEGIAAMQQALEALNNLSEGDAESAEVQSAKAALQVALNG